MKKIVMLLAIMLVIPFMSAIDKPANIFTITQPDPLSTTVEGQPCTTTYETTAGYCSGGIRQYYQCLPRMGGNQWVRDSENCNDYNGQCVIQNSKAQCIAGGGQSSFFSTKNILIGAGALVVLWFIFKKK